jgi:Taurine catabolism dioxygenase TauD, TfdA family
VRELPALDAHISSEEALRHGPGSDLDGVVPETWKSCSKQVFDLLSSSPHACVVRNAGFAGLPAPQRGEYVKAIAHLFGEISDNNRFSARSNVFVDEVKPTEPGSRDVTFTLGACEAHSDESSKLVPEDIVILWCVRPARDGGASCVWPASDLEAFVRARPGGQELVAVLREPGFPFGGRLRNPPRVLRAPILFGTDGIRFRLGSLRDGLEVTGQELAGPHKQALAEMIQAIEAIDPFCNALEADDLLIMLNRRVLHSRTDFTDRDRLLLRTRCFNDTVSNRAQDNARWLS